MKLIEKVLIANRGEIALRIIRSAKKMGIQTIALFVDSENKAGYVQEADEAFSLGSGALEETFLNIEKIISIARQLGAQAIHPGYGFLSENSTFSAACEANNLLFVGPNGHTLDLMGNKPKAKELAQKLGIPVAKSVQISTQNRSIISEFPLPAILKASFGGGGKGMQIVNSIQDLETAIERSTRMAQNYFGNGELFLEQYIPNARHVEVQLLGDRHHNLIHLFERECSVQRNHQKIVEEAPALFLAPALRNKILDSALILGQAVHYEGAGTVEFLVDEHQNYYFMEMNPRIQVEHGVTEQVTGIDLIAEQFKIASGFPLSFSQTEISCTGHAIEARVYAENPHSQFTPSQKQIQLAHFPTQPNIRMELDIEGIRQNPSDFDPLLAKVIATGKNRDEALAYLKESLNQVVLLGPDTNLEYLKQILSHPIFEENTHSILFCSQHHNQLVEPSDPEVISESLPYLIAGSLIIGYKSRIEKCPNELWYNLGYWRMAGYSIPILINNQRELIRMLPSGLADGQYFWNNSPINFHYQHIGKEGLKITIKKNTILIYYVQTSEGIQIQLNGQKYLIVLPETITHHPKTFLPRNELYRSNQGEVYSPIHGKILEINVKENQLVQSGDLLMIIESMKTENRILATRDGKVKRIEVKVGTQVSDRMPLIYWEEEA